jgi:Holliday junction DNA helicase RuvA
MLAEVKGTLLSVQGHTLTLRPDGPLGEALCLEVMVPSYLAQRLSTRVGEGLCLRTSMIFQGESQGSSFTPVLLGFGDAEELAFFDLFTTVKGIGVRKALRALAEPPGTVAGAIVRGDAKGLCALPEIGKRLAETIIAELKGKADKFASTGGLSPVATIARQPVLPQARPDALAGPAGDAVEALIRLGEQRAEAERKVARALDRHAGSDRLASPEGIVGLVFAGG